MMFDVHPYIVHCPYTPTLSTARAPQSEIYRRGNVENGWKSLIMVDHAWKCQWSKKILSWL